MNGLAYRLAFALALLLSLASLARAGECERLVTALDKTVTRQNGQPQAESFSFPVPTTSGEWFLTVHSNGVTSGELRVNGAVVLAPADFRPSVTLLRRRITPSATNACSVEVSGSPGDTLRVLVQGVVRRADLATEAGLHVFRRNFLGETFTGSATRNVSVPSADGLFSLNVVNGPSGGTRASSAHVSWNGLQVLGPSDFAPQIPGAVEPVLCQPGNVLSVDVQAPGNASTSVELIGILVDEVAPDLTILAPPANTWVGAGAELLVRYSDSISGVEANSFKVLLNGQDVTASVAATTSEARALLTALRPALVDGTNTLRVEVRDNACNLTVREATVLFDSVSPTITVVKPAENVLAGGGPGGGVACEVQYADAHSGVDLATFHAELDGADVTSSFSVQPTQATGTFTALSDGQHVLRIRLRDNVGNEVSTERRFSVDARPPSLALSPVGAVGESTPPILATFSDPSPGSGVDLASLVVKLDGTVLTPVAVLEGTAIYFPPTALPAGIHHIEGSLADHLGNRTQKTVDFAVQLGAAGFVLGMSPSDPTSVELLTTNDLILRAVTAGGATDATFTGLVQVTISDGLMPLDDLLVEFLAGHQGQVRVRDVAMLRAVGVHTIRATAVANASITGSLQVTGVTAVPTWTATTIGGDGSATLVGSTLPNATVELLVDGVVVARGSSRSDGSFQLAVVLPAGAHDVRVRASDGVTTVTSPLQRLGAPSSVKGVLVNGAEFTNAPLEGITIRIEGANLSARTDQEGAFRFAAVPAGNQVLVIDGASRGFGYQRLHVPSSGIVDLGSIALRPVDYSQGVEPAFASPGVVTGFTVHNQLVGTTLEVLPGTSLTVPADAPKKFTVSTILPGDLPIAFPLGAAAQMAFSFQPEGANFGKVRVRFPNQPGLAAGERVAIWHYRAESGEFEVSGHGVVSPDEHEIVYEPDWPTGIYIVDLGSSLPGQVDVDVLATVKAQDRSGTNVIVPASEVKIGVVGLVRLLAPEPDPLNSTAPAPAVFRLTVRGRLGETARIRATRTFKPASGPEITTTTAKDVTIAALPAGTAFLPVEFQLDSPLTVEGHVRESRFSLPLANATVTVNGFVTTTDSTGFYRVTNVPTTSPATTVSVEAEKILIRGSASTVGGPGATLNVDVTAYPPTPNNVNIPPPVRTAAQASGDNGQSGGLLFTTLVYNSATGKFYTGNQEGFDRLVEVQRNFADVGNYNNFRLIQGGFGRGGLQREGITVASDGPKAWVAEGHYGTVYRVSLDTGSLETLADNLNPLRLHDSNLPPLPFPDGAAAFPLMAPFLSGNGGASVLVNFHTSWYRVHADHATDPYGSVSGTGTIFGQSFARHATAESFYLSNMYGTQPNRIDQVFPAPNPIGTVWAPAQALVTNVPNGPALFMQVHPQSGTSPVRLYAVTDIVSVPGLGVGGRKVVEVVSNGTNPTVVYTAPAGTAIFGIALAPTDLPTNPDTALYALVSNIQDVTLPATSAVTAQLVEVRIDPTYASRYPTPTFDGDHDGLIDALEFLAGSSPDSANTDGDGRDDYVEFVTGTSPTTPNAFPPLEVVRAYPQANATGVYLDTGIFLDFNVAIAPGSALGAIKLARAGTQPTDYVPGACSAVAGVPNRFIFRPAAALAQTATYTIVAVANGAHATTGESLTTDLSVATFTTGSVRAAGDDDGDGLLNAEEDALGTQKNDTDSDDDDLTDYEELCGDRGHTDPNGQDTDGDGLKDGSDPTPNGQPTPPVTTVPPGGDPTSPALVSLTPLSGETKVPLSLLPAAKFDHPLNPAKERAVFTVPNHPGQTVPDPLDAAIVRFVPDVPFDAGTPVSATVVLYSIGPGGQETAVTNRTTTYTYDVPPTTSTVDENVNYNEALQFTTWEVFRPLIPSVKCGCGCGGEGARSGVSYAVPANRAFVSQTTDVAIKGASPDFHVTRTYRSRSSAPAGLFGPNWFCNYDRQFLPQPNGDLKFVDEDGRVYDYKKPSPVATTWTPSPGRYERVSLTNYQGANNVVQRQLVGGLRFYYHQFVPNGPYRLIWIEDSNEERIALTRDATGRLTSLRDSIDRDTTFSYYGGTDARAGLLQSVTDHSGRRWVYDYDMATGALVRMETPAAEYYDYDTAGKLVGPVNAPRVVDYGYAGGAPSRLVSVGVRGLLAGGVAPASEQAMRIGYTSSGEVAQIDFGAGTAFYDTDSSGNALQIDRAGNVTRLAHTANGGDSLLDVSSARIETRGFRSVDPDPTSYTIIFLHDTNHEVTRVTRPRGNFETFTRDASTGQVTAHTREHNGSGADKVIKQAFDYEPIFNRVRRATEPRAFRGDTGAPLTADVVDGYSTYFFYDHEDVKGVAIPAAKAAVGPGLTWSLARRLLRTHGRTTLSGSDYVANAGAFDVDKDGDGLPDLGGNLYVVRGPRPKQVQNGGGTTWQLGAPQEIETSHTYNKYGQHVLSVSPDGHRERHEWQPKTYPAPVDAGYMRLEEHATAYTDEDLDPDSGLPVQPASGSGLGLATRFEHDAVGNTLSTTDPRGHKTRHVVDAMNLVVETIGPAPFGYRTKLSYDAHNNTVRDELQNVVPDDVNDNGIQDDDTEQRADGFFENFYRFDSVNNLVLTNLDARGAPAPRGHAAQERVITVLTYDQKQRLVAVREAEGNVHTTSYDERDLVVETVLGASEKSTAQTTRFKFDENGNLTKIFDDDGNQNPATTLAYDLFDRPVQSTDEVGDYAKVTYDLASNVVQVEQWEKRSGGDVLLAKSYSEFDEAGRRFQSDREWFNVLSGSSITKPAGTGSLVPPVTVPSAKTLVRTVVAFHPDGKVERVVDDNGNVTTFEHDEADRQTKVIDAAGNSVESVYDEDSLVVRTVTTEKRTDGQPDEIYSSEMFHDEQHRLVMSVSNLWNTRRFLYDSRDNLVQISDAMGAESTQTLPTFVATPKAVTRWGSNGTPRPGVPSAPVPGSRLNERGNTTRFKYDGLSRPIETIRDLRSDGSGRGLLDRAIVTRRVHDANSRLVEQHDDNGNVTGYCYDHQNRLVRTVYGNQTRRQLTWVNGANRTSTVKVDADPRNVVKRFTYDAKEQLTRVDVDSPPPGVGQTTFKTFSYDGAGRMTVGTDDDSEVGAEYDSLGNRVAQEQEVTVAGGAKRRFRVLCEYDGLGNKTGIAYPARTEPAASPRPSALTVRQTFDSINRVRDVKESGGTLIASYEHVGMGSRRTKRSLGNGTETHSTFDQERRVVLHEHSPTGSPSSPIRRFEYTWDRENNRRTENEAVRALGSFYTYDSAYRLTRDVRNVASASLPAALVGGAANASMQNLVGFATNEPTGAATVLTTYDLDGANNRRVVKDGSRTVAYSMSAHQSWAPTANQELPPFGAALSDAAVNQYSSISDTQLGTTLLTHDLAGNQISGNELGEQRFFDADDQLVQITSNARDRDVRYRYDVTGHRVSKTILSLGGTVQREVLYVSDGTEELEEWSADAAATQADKRFVYGERIDEPLRMTVTASNGNYWFHENSIGSVVALTDQSGAVVESYRYRAYGEFEEILDASSQAQVQTQVGNPFGFQGRRLDYEEGLGLYQFRARYYDPTHGRFVSRDPLGMWGDPAQLGSGHSALAANPLNRRDPFGDKLPTDDDPFHTPSNMRSKGPVGTTGDAREIAEARVKREMEREDAAVGHGRRFVRESPLGGYSGPATNADGDTGTHENYRTRFEDAVRRIYTRIKGSKIFRRLSHGRRTRCDFEYGKISKDDHDAEASYDRAFDEWVINVFVHPLSGAVDSFARKARWHGAVAKDDKEYHRGVEADFEKLIVALLLHEAAHCGQPFPDTPAKEHWRILHLFEEENLDEATRAAFDEVGFDAEDRAELRKSIKDSIAKSLAKPK